MKHLEQAIFIAIAGEQQCSLSGTTFADVLAIHESKHVT